MSKIDLSKLSNVDFNNQYVNKQGEVKQRGWLGRLIQTVAGSRARSSEINVLSSVIATLQKTSGSHETFEAKEKAIQRLSGRLDELRGAPPRQSQVDSVARKSIDRFQPPEAEKGMREIHASYMANAKEATALLDDLQKAGHPLQGGRVVKAEMAQITSEYLSALESRTPPDEKAVALSELAERLRTLTSDSREVLKAHEDFSSLLFATDDKIKNFAEKFGDAKTANSSWLKLRGIMQEYLRASDGAKNTPQMTEGIKAVTEQLHALQQMIDERNDGLSDLRKMDELMASLAPGSEPLDFDDTEPALASAEDSPALADRPSISIELEAEKEIKGWQGIQVELFMSADAAVLDSFQTRFDDLLNAYLNSNGAISKDQFLTDVAKLTEEAQKATETPATTPSTTESAPSESQGGKWIETGKTYISQLDALSLSDEVRDEVDELKQQFDDLSKAISRDPDAIETLEEIVMQMGEKVAELQ